ncbi:MAG: thiamine pyrophosphate-binding protein [Velocimicrobium sp.]
MTVSEYLVDFLISKGVTDVFGIPGGVVLDFLYALDGRKEINAHLSYHEQGAAFAACGYAQCHHSLGAAYATRGPGFTNLITGIADAYSDSLPVMLITAHSGTVVKNSMRFEQNQEMDTVSMISNITKYATVIDEVESACVEINRAYNAAMSGRKGPVLLDFSARLWNRELGDSFEKYIANQNIGTCASDVEGIIEIIKTSRQPILLVGDGVRQAGTVDEVVKLSKKLNIPVVSSRCSQDVGAVCENYYGYIGSHGIRYSNFIFAKADVVLALGNRMSFPVNSESFQKALINKKIIRIDIDKDEFKREIPNSFTIEADLRQFLPQFNAVDYKQKDTSDWLNVCIYLKNKLVDFDTNEAVQMVKTVFSVADSKNVIVSDVGNNEFWTSRGYELAGAKARILYSKSFGALGCSLGKSIGAYYASKLPIVCIVGDQGFQLNVQELQLISKEKLPIAIILLNNNSSGMIRDQENKRYHGHFVDTTKSTGYGTPNFELIAKSYGVDYYRVDIESRQKIEQVLRRVTNPVLVEIVLNEEIALTPNLEKGKPMQVLTPELEVDFNLELEILL